MKQLVFILSSLSLLLMVSCSIEPAKIDYGKDQCDFCVMNIVDKTHAAQYVTKKGKQFKFDAIECMMRDLKKKDKADLAMILVADFSEPGKMIQAESANYIISKKIKSPMGANLSAVSTLEKAKSLKKEFKGKLYTWDSLTERFNK